MREILLTTKFKLGLGGKIDVGTISSQYTEKLDVAGNIRTTGSTGKIFSTEQQDTFILQAERWDWTDTNVNVGSIGNSRNVKANRFQSVKVVVDTSFLNSVVVKLDCVSPA